MLYTKTGRFFTELLKNKKGIVLHVHCIETLLRTVVIVHPAAGLLSGGRRCGGFFDMPGDGFGGCTTQHSFFYWINAHSMSQKNFYNSKKLESLFVTLYLETSGSSGFASFSIPRHCLLTLFCNLSS